MWGIVKFLFWLFVVLVLAVPVFKLFGKIADVVIGLFHRWQMDSAEREAAWADTRRKQVSWHGPDEKGFTGIVHDDATGLWYNPDTGERWKDDGTPIGRPDRSRRAVHDKQRLSAAGRGSARTAPPAAQVTTVQAKTSTDGLNEPGGQVQLDTIQS